MASIQVALRGRFVHGCGGSVIETNLVLKAAHALREKYKITSGAKMLLQKN